MIIKTIKLKNIRSYVNQEIELPESSVLLSGDIGSGKSTVLLAIDFALFGLRKSDLSGASLLRNGTNNGSVELHFEIDGKDVVIKRTLKKSSGKIVQDSGYISINGIKREGTAVELKQSILNLLNYPKELLTKSKNLIYKYTVYTPQEEMKYILTEAQDLRLDTLRRVFGIDKYKTVKENTKIFTSALKEKKKEFAGMIHDLEIKKEEKQKKDLEKDTQNKKLEELKPRLELIRQDYEKKKQEIASTENQIKELNELKQSAEIKSLELNTKRRQRLEIEEELQKLIKQIEEIKKEIAEESLEDIEAEIRIKQNKKEKIEEDEKKHGSEITILQTKLDQSEQLKEQITVLENCPTCQQKVTQEHKSTVLTEEDNKIEAINKKLVLSNQNYKLNKQQLEQVTKELDNLLLKKQKIAINKLKRESYEEKIRRKEELEAQQEILGNETKKIKAVIDSLTADVQKFQNIEAVYKEKKEELEKIRDKKNKINTEEAVLKNDFKNLNETITALKIEIEQKEKTKQKLIYLTQLQNWLEEQFTNLMDVMEKNIMLKVHSDFDALFQRWFNMLIEADSLQAKLDTTFTPLVEQNGHDINYDYLSGGEKTAVALAYRLALNQVINKLMRTIKTSDLLILDEPTDGFSTEQLDKVKDVIEDLQLKQIIIVSHEPKVESFVNNVIKFQKENHISSAS